MAFTKTYARIAAGMLSEGAVRFLESMERNSIMGMSPAAHELQTLGFIKEVGGLWELTPNGKKVSAEL